MDNKIDDKVESTKLDEKIEETPQTVVLANLSPKDFATIPMEDITLSAHELRTVLTIMRNYLWVSTYQQDEPLGPKVKRNLSVVSFALDYLVMLVENNLIVRKIEKSEIKMAPEDVDLVEMVDEMMTNYADKAAAAGIHLVHEPSIQKAMVCVDIQKTKDTIGRIIENAIKFTPKQGKISFKITDSDDEEFHEIHISDTGPGIPKYLHRNLFTKFGKIEESYANVEGQNGAGLGLYIAKYFIELQKGKIEVVSDAGAGAKFVVSLPVKSISENK